MGIRRDRCPSFADGRRKAHHRFLHIGVGLKFEDGADKVRFSFYEMSLCDGGEAGAAQPLTGYFRGEDIEAELEASIQLETDSASL